MQVDDDRLQRKMREHEEAFRSDVYRRLTLARMPSITEDMERSRDLMRKIIADKVGQSAPLKFDGYSVAWMLLVAFGSALCVGFIVGLALGVGGMKQ